MSETAGPPPPASGDGPEPPRRLHAAVWGVILLAAILGVQALVGGAVTVAFVLSGGDPDRLLADLLSPPGGETAGFGEAWTAALLLSAAAATAAVGLPLSVVAIRNRFGSFREVWGRPSGRAVGYGLLGLGMILGLAAALAATVEPLAKETFENSPQARLSGALAKEWLLPISIPIAGLLAPAAEEFIFRGFFYRAAAGWLERRQRSPRRAFWGAALVSAGLWAAIHGDPVVMPVIGAFGVILAWVYVRSKSLLAPLLTHAAWNTVTLVALTFFLRPA